MPKRTKEEIAAEKEKEKLRALRRGPDLDRFLEGKKRTFVSYAEGARIYSMNYYSFVTLAKAAKANIRIKKNVVIDLDAIEEYLEKRSELKRVFLLIDFRLKPGENDLMMYNFLKYYNIPVTVVATKTDKVGTSKKDRNLKIIKDTLDLVVGDNIVLFSSVSKMGKEEISNLIEDLIS